MSLKASEIKKGDRVLLVEVHQNDAYHRHLNPPLRMIAHPDGDGFRDKENMSGGFISGGFQVEGTTDRDNWCWFYAARFERVPE